MDYTTLLHNTWQGYWQSKIATSVKENFIEKKTHKRNYMHLYRMHEIRHNTQNIIR